MQQPKGLGAEGGAGAVGFLEAEDVEEVCFLTRATNSRQHKQALISTIHTGQPFRSESNSKGINLLHCPAKANCGGKHGYAYHNTTLGCRLGLFARWDNSPVESQST